MSNRSNFPFFEDSSSDEEEKLSRSCRKRPFFEDEDSDDDDRPSTPKRARFPKGKKVKPEEEESNIGDVRTLLGLDPILARAQRARRHRESNPDIKDVEITECEIVYDDDENFVEDGVQIEPFNLKEERKVGYFDERGNFVQCFDDKFNDPWLDSLEFANPKLARKKVPTPTSPTPTVTRNNSEDAEGNIGTIKRRIANVLEPGETVLQVLRRLKGTSKNRNEKMSAETKKVFDQLTDDATWLLENGDNNVYNKRQEAFELEAKGHERLAKAIGKRVADTPAEVSSSANSKSLIMLMTKALGYKKCRSSYDHAYDKSSVYKESSSLGYRYEPSTGLYFSVSSGQWFCYNEKTGTFEKVY